ncbi:hypothetical protein GCM10010349_74940 [Streptomyces flavofungini]|nr:hypothetical protein GCM10010349_74940 [Streptomyces flavofungini]
MIDHLRDRGLGVDAVCRALDLSPSTYFARKKRPKSARRLRDGTLMPLVEEIHAESGGACGTRRITRALRPKDVDVARCTVERLMVELGLEDVIRGWRRRTTVPEPSAPRPPDLVDRDFTANRPDRLWVADMTYVRTWPGWAYVAFVLDVHSRMNADWQVANPMRTELPLDALEMALWQRRFKKDPGLIHHSDRGSQYVSIRYTDRLADIGACASVGSVADSHDNAMAEALNGTFKAELTEMQGPWKDGDQAERAIFHWITWHSEEPLHPALDYVPLRTARRVRASLLAEPGASPAVRLNHQDRTLRNSGQLKSPGNCRSAPAGPQNTPGNCKIPPDRARSDGVPGNEPARTQEHPRPGPIEDRVHDLPHRIAALEPADGTVPVLPGREHRLDQRPPPVRHVALVRLAFTHPTDPSRPPAPDRHVPTPPTPSGDTRTTHRALSELPLQGEDGPWRLTSFDSGCTVIYGRCAMT